jgi:AcrR family transcriptional regulator
MSSLKSSKKIATQPRGKAFVSEIMEVTLAQLAEVGYERLSIPLIAELAGVNKTSIYRRWPSKTELVRDAFGSAMSHADQVPDTGELRGDLMALTKSGAVFMQSSLGKALIKIMLSEGGNPQLSALAQMAQQHQASSGPAAVMARAVARGELKSSLDPSLILFTLAGAIMHRIFVEQKKPTDSFIKQIVELVLTGALTKPR